jgi:hypothetical protein
MKVDFNKDGMTINFEKVPRLIYFNEEGRGCGGVFFDGKRIKGLQDIKIQARTRDKIGCPPLKYRIQYCEKGTNGEPLFISNMKEGLSVSVKITDLEIFEKLIDWAKNIISDERIPEEARLEYWESLNAVISSNTTTLYAEGVPYVTFKEEENNESK